MPVTLLPHQLLIRHVVTSPIHTHEPVLRYKVTLQVCTYLKIMQQIFCAPVTIVVCRILHLHYDTKISLHERIWF
jgi:hypothetical protein